MLPLEGELVVVGNSPEDHEWEGLRISMSRFDLSATEVDIIS